MGKHKSSPRAFKSQWHGRVELQVANYGLNHCILLKCLMEKQESPPCFSGDICHRFKTFSGKKAAKERRLIKPSTSSAAFPHGQLLSRLLQWRSQDPACRLVQTQSLQALPMTLLWPRAGRMRWWCSGARRDGLLQAGHLHH